MSMSRNFCLSQSLQEVEVGSTSSNSDCNKNIARHVILGHVTLGNDSYNLCLNGAMKLRDQLQEKLPSVTALIYCGDFELISFEPYCGMPRGQVRT